MGVHANIAAIVRDDGGEILLSNILAQYEKRHGKKPTNSYSGKFKSFVGKIPGVKVVGNGAYAIWVGTKTSAKKNAPEKDEAKKIVKKDEVKIAVHDSSADIITFKESVGGKSAQQCAQSNEDAFDLGAGFDNMSLTEKAAATDEAALSFFLPKTLSNEIQKNKGLSLFSSSSIERHSEGALFGYLSPLSSSESTGGAVYLNTHEPFCFVTVGVQGAGKSHTSSCVLESCLVPFAPGNIVKLNAPMITMVLHYDQNTSSICEAAGLLSPNPAVKARMTHVGHDVGAVPKEKAVILVSPAFYQQRKKFYGDICTVKPLLFRWRSLTADHIKRIMRIESGDNQLYVASFLDLLRSYQRQGKCALPWHAL